MGFHAALSGSQLTKLRGATDTVPTYAAAQYLSLCPNTTVFAARVNQATFTASFADITYDTVTVGSFGAIDAGQTIYLSSTNSIRDAYFTGRIRKAADATKVYLNETSVAIADNDFIFVVDDFRLWDKLPREVSNVQRKDYEITVRAIPPIVNGLQSAYAGIVSGSPAGLTIAFSVTGLACTSGATISSYAWTIETGMTVTAGSASTASVTIRFDAGFYWLKLVVTDSGGRTITRWTPIWAVPADLSAQVALGFTGSQISGDESGWNASIEAFTGIDSVYDGTLCVIWDVETYNGAEGSIQTNVKFVGRLRTEETTGDSDENYSYLLKTQFEIEGVASQMARLEMRPIAMRWKASVTKWDEITNLTVWRAIVHVLHEHSTYFNLHDLTFDSSDNTFLAKILSTQGGSLYEVVGDLAGSLTGKFETEPSGKGQIVRDARYLTTAQRAALTTVADWTTQDFMSLSLSVEHVELVGRVEGSGGSFNASIPGKRVVPFLSIAPGAAQAYPTDRTQLTGQILAANAVKVAAQLEINQRTGHHYALSNGADELTITHPDGYNWLVPSANQWFTWTLDTSTNLRGRAYTTANRWLIRSVSITHDNERGTKEVEAAYVLETAGTPGQTFTLPKIGQIGLNLDPLPTMDVYGSFPTNPILLYGTNPTGDNVRQPYNTEGDALRPAPTDGNTVAVWTDDTLYLCKDFLLTDSPTWEDITPSDIFLVGGVNDVRYFLFDGFGRGAYVLARAATGGNYAVWSTADVFAGPPIWTKGAHQAGAIDWRVLRLTSTRSQVYIREETSNNGAARYSGDGGATFGSNLTTAGGASSDYAFDTQKVGSVALSAANASVYRSTTAGGAFSSYSGTIPDGGAADAALIPRLIFGSTTTGNDGSNVEFLVGSIALTGSNTALWKCTASGATFTNITPQFTDYGHIPNNARNDALAMPWGSGSIIAAVLTFGSTPKLAVSTNAGAAWTDRGALTDPWMVKMRRGDSAMQQLYLADGAGGPKYSPDFGATILSKGKPDSSDIIGIQVYG